MLNGDVTTVIAAVSAEVAAALIRKTILGVSSNLLTSKCCCHCQKIRIFERAIWKRLICGMNRSKGSNG
jgi:hypothetical protein